MQQTEFFVILDQFLPFYPPSNPKNQNFEKMKKRYEDIIILHLHTTNDDHMDVWFLRYGAQETDFFLISEYFCPFALLTTWKIKILKKWKKTLGDITVLHMCTINENHRMYVSWDMEHDRHNCFSFWTIFCPFTPLTSQKTKILKKWKNFLEISFFHTSIP